MITAREVVAALFFGVAFFVFTESSGIDTPVWAGGFLYLSILYTIEVVNRR